MFAIECLFGYVVKVIEVIVNICPVCSGDEFQANAVLWPALVNAWELSDDEVTYINRQQGFVCIQCGANIRSMALANAILKSYDFKGDFIKFCNSFSKRKLRVLEINPAGTLTSHLMHLPRHQLISFPEHDMRDLKIDSGSFDLIIHSDTLEHIDSPVRSMEECRRVLKVGGRCIFTVPIIVERLSRSRAGLAPSYHGCESDVGSDLLVQSEFGADFWSVVLQSGFNVCAIHCLEYPAGLAIEAKC